MFPVYAYDINDSGQVAGYSGLAPAGFEAFVYDATNGMRRLGTLAAPGSQARAINNLGQLAGSTYIPSGDLHAFLYRNGVMEDLFLPLNTSSSQALDLNDAGQVVGICDSGSSSPTAFLWQNSVIYSLTSTITNADWELQSAQGINQHGQIVGYGRKGGAPDRRAFLLTPDAPPFVSLASPANGTEFVAPIDIPLTATATDVESGIRKVEFFANGTLIATDISFPFSHLWSNVPVGTHAVTAVATDRRDLISTSAPVNITVLFINRPPMFATGPDQNVLEDSGAQNVAGWASAIRPGPENEAGQALTFLVTNDSPALFATPPALDSSGSLIFGPAPDAFGMAVVTVVLKDDGGTANGGQDTSAAQSFTISVSPVNDPPTFVKGSDQILNEDAGPQAVPDWAANIRAGPANEMGQRFLFAAANDNPGLFSIQPAISPAGTLTFSGAPDACGLANVTVVLVDDGGSANGGLDRSAPSRFQINIRCVNDCPVAVSQSVTADEHTPVSISLVGTDPDGDALAFQVVSLPSKGALTGAGAVRQYTPAGPGLDSFSFRVSDPQCTSALATVTINVRDVNDPPTAIIEANTLCNPAPIITNLVVISPNGSNGCVVLNASMSTDPDRDPLTYAWLLDASPVSFSYAAHVTNCVEAGTHTIHLVVDDGEFASSAIKDVTVITACEAVEGLILSVNSGNLNRNTTRPLIATLKAACASLERENTGSGINQLQAFQNKVRAQAARANPALAAQWIATAQYVIDALSPCQ